MASCVSVASSMLVTPATASAASLSSSKSVSFSNGGLRVSSLTVQRSPARRSLFVRADGANDENVVDKVKNAVSDLSQNIQDAMPGNKQPAASPGRKPGAGRQGQELHKSSTGGLTEAAKEAAERTAVVFDGVKENIMERLQDDGRDLKSKTSSTVKYGAHRNADDIPADITQKNIKEQSEYTKNLGKKD